MRMGPEASPKVSSRPSSSLPRHVEIKTRGPVLRRTFPVARGQGPIRVDRP